MKIENMKSMTDMIRVTSDMWLKGWHERNGGNASYRLPEEDSAFAVKRAMAEKKRRRGNLETALPILDGDVFLVTGSGKYFRNISLNPADTLGIVKIVNWGTQWELLWGFTGGANPTSELSAHLGSHAARKKASNGKDRVILHTHATNLTALTYRYPADSAVFSRLLWEMSTECLVVFPEGIGLLPWMVPGTKEIGSATAELMDTHRLVLWPFHGVFGTGSDPDEAFGLIDTAEKAAEILVKVDSMGGKKYTIQSEELTALARRFSVTPLKEIV